MSFKTESVGQIIIALFTLTIVALVVFGFFNEPFKTLVIYQFQVIVLLPVSGLFSFVLVASFQKFSGDIEFKALGFEFSGASGPVIMWAISFIAIVVSINLLWVQLEVDQYKTILQGGLLDDSPITPSDDN